MTNFHLLVAHTFRARIAFLVWIRYQSSEATDMDDTRACSTDLRSREFLFVFLAVDLHVRETRLRHDERACEVSFDVGLPLLKDRFILHSLVVWPVRSGDSRVVDEEIYAVVQEGGSLADRLAYLVHRTQITYRPADILGVFL